MIKIKFIKTLIAIVIIVLVLLSSNNTVQAKDLDKKLQNNNLINSKDTHVIDDVPYVGQETGIDCEICSFSMLVKYLDKNYSLHDIFYLIGSGYALGCNSATLKQKLTPSLRPNSISPGSLSCIWKNDWDFISNILGVNCKIEYDNSLNSEVSWVNYWDRVKKYISNETPVYTQIDMSVLSYNKKYGEYEVGSGICHAIVVVGYNESNGTVCINDPGPAFENRPGEGRYFYENYSVFKAAVTNSTKSGYVIYKYGYLTITLEDKSEALPKNTAYEMAHYRNLGKMQGCEWAYDDVFIDANSKFGIHALEEFQKNINFFKFLYKTPIWRFENRVSTLLFNDSVFPFDMMPYFLYVIKQEKQFTAEVLKNNCINTTLTKEGYLLENESNKWGELYNLYDNMVCNISEKGLFYSMIFSISNVIKMKKVIKDIKEIEMEILNLK